MRSMNVVGAFVCSKGITKNSQWLYRVLNVVFGTSDSLIFNWWYTDLKSIFENQSQNTLNSPISSRIDFFHYIFFKIHQSSTLDPDFFSDVQYKLDFGSRSGIINIMNITTLNCYNNIDNIMIKTILSA